MALRANTLLLTLGAHRHSSGKHLHHTRDHVTREPASGMVTPSSMPSRRACVSTHIGQCGSPTFFDGRIMNRSFDLVRSAVRREFTEWPTVSLTLQQACRYWGIEPTICAPLLEELVEEGFLVRRVDGRFTRAQSGRTPVKATLRSTEAYRPHDGTVQPSRRMSS